ncbi:S-layer homology domain-containing protein [Cytobacillus sp. IB215316]|uniref:S-layer homology domain-containing protein n=1 Tax=Cytobacillus sp. IB215316 TaxID=3097354 RepID=UPI002A16E28A|nr:S-layer homology domain-containing protein [Cytobacillus sp. IB215316]MDX8360781.1 S-layer homology domain-containing protein [Cytobacillus sp. IB215316]
MKKLLSYILIFVLLMPVTVQGAVQNEPSEWFREDIQQGIELGLIPERLQSDYLEPITREEFAELLVNYVLINLDEQYEFQETPIRWTKDSILEKVTIDTPFEDTDLEHVQLAYIMGSVNGTSETTFSPDNYITRQQAAMMLMNTVHLFNEFDYLSEADLGYEDFNQIYEGAQPAVNALKGLGIMKGSGGEFLPLNNITREQAMVTVVRLYNETVYPLLTVRGEIVANPVIPEFLYNIGSDYVHVSYVEELSEQSMSELETVWYLFADTRESGIEIDINNALALYGFEYNLSNISAGLFTDPLLRGENIKVDYGFMEVETLTDNFLMEFTLKPTPGYVHNFFEYFYGYPKTNVIPEIIQN